MNSIKVSPSSLIRPHINFGRLKTPSPLPIRPLPVDRFRPPRGQKEVFLPNFVITFLHTPTRPANFASFSVPLWFSKLDLKDYLYHVYSVHCLRIRSYVIQAPVRQGKPADVVIVPRRWFRPASTKKMTVELVVSDPLASSSSSSSATTKGGSDGSSVKGQGPFVWPEEPTDWSPWTKKEFDDNDKRQEEGRERWKEETRGTAWPNDLERLGDRADALLKKAGVARDSIRADWRVRSKNEEEKGRGEAKKRAWRKKVAKAEKRGFGI